MHLLIALVLLVLMQSHPSVPVTVSTVNPKVSVRENGKAVLSCEFRTERDQDPRIEWKKKGKDVSFVYFDGQFRGSFVQRAHIAGATVTLERVTQQDAGEYRCEVSAPQDHVTLGETNVTLIVLVPPHTPSCEIPRSALTGSVVELRCRDQHSVPAATYTWYKDMKLLSAPASLANATYSIDPLTGVLKFKTVTRADTGQYHCVAKNLVGTKSCLGNHMKIDDMNIAGIVSGVVVVCLVVSVCVLGACYAHRHGYFSRHRGRSFWIPQCHGTGHISSQNLHRAEDTTNTTSYSPPPQEPLDFKHTQSFML